VFSLWDRSEKEMPDSNGAIGPVGSTITSPMRNGVKHSPQAVVINRPPIDI
jgi:hypothetical protein